MNKKHKRPLRVYIAAPYSRGDVCMNVRMVIHTADFLMKQNDLNVIPYVPHLTHLWHMIFPKKYEEWLEYDRHWIEVCDVLLRLCGNSPGADKEVDHARSRGILVMDMRNPIEDVRHRLWKRKDVQCLFYLMAATWGGKE